MIRFGTAGWAYRDWAGIVYPASRGRGFREAAYLARYVDALEVNVTFYRPVPARTSATWVRAVEDNPNFRFTAKLWQRFTHDRDGGESEARLVDEGLRPLVDAGRLGALLLQFPFSFHCTPANRDHVLRLADRFSAYPLVLEVRHASWNREPGVAEALRAAQIGICNVDQPALPNNVAPSADVTSPVGYVRLHGRNAAAWWTSEQGDPARYDYLYAPDELATWAHRVHDVAAAAREVYVVANNHFRGQAVVNALELQAAVRGAPVDVPPELVAAYPRLREVARPVAGDALLLDLERS